MHAVTHTPRKQTRPVCTIRTNRFGGYMPVLHTPGTAAPQHPTSGIAFATAAEAILHARTHLGAILVALPGTPAPTPLTAA